MYMYLFHWKYIYIYTYYIYIYIYLKITWRLWACNEPHRSHKPWLSDAAGELGSLALGDLGLGPPHL